MKRELYQATDIESNIIRSLEEKYGMLIQKDVSCYILGCIMIFARSYITDDKSVLVIGDKKDLIFYCTKNAGTFEDAEEYYYQLNSSFDKDTISDIVSQSSNIFKITCMESDCETVSRFLQIGAEYANIVINKSYIGPVIDTVVHELVSWINKNKGVYLNLFGVFDINYWGDTPVLSISPVINKIQF